MRNKKFKSQVVIDTNTSLNLIIFIIEKKLVIVYNLNYYDYSFISKNKITKHL